MDPLSLAASIVSFIDASDKMKTTLAEVADHKANVRQAMDEISQDLSEIVRFCQNRHQALNADEITDLKASIDDLRSTLMDVHIRGEAVRVGHIGGLLARTRARFSQNNIEADILRLWRHVRACRLRFLTSTSVRTEHNVVVLGREQSDRLAHLETLVVQVLAVSDQDVGFRVPISDSAGLPTPEHDFLQRQVRKVCSRVRQVGLTPFIFVEEPRGRHLDSKGRPTSLEALNLEMRFSRALIAVCQANHILRPSSTGTETSAQDFAFAMYDLANVLDILGLTADAAAISSFSVELYSKLFASTQAIEFCRHLGATSRFLSFANEDKKSALSSSKQAVDIFDTLFKAYGKSDDLDNLLTALRTYSWDLRANVQVEECVDVSQQTLILHREWTSLQDRGYLERGDPLVTWSASGESTVVFSSERRPSHSRYIACEEAFSLWGAASALAASARYAEAHVAAWDATRCAEAVVLTSTSSSSYLATCLAEWRIDLASWVSLVRTPNETAASITETDGEGAQ
ncbi:hypothetical protein HGRIS_007260 [Hohenbuehelia grisea]|uniref:Uncharacterized protein n=1 Tax=Hohenbuehelia grisea TaxID=104357 RepID=A0ABR3JBJ0_9AGAR